MGSDVRFGRNGRDHLKRGLRFVFDDRLCLSAYRRRDQLERHDVEQAYRQRTRYRDENFGDCGFKLIKSRNLNDGSGSDSARRGFEYGSPTGARTHRDGKR